MSVSTDLVWRVWYPPGTSLVCITILRTYRDYMREVVRARRLHPGRATVEHGTASTFFEKKSILRGEFLETLRILNTPIPEKDDDDIIVSRKT